MYLVRLTDVRLTLLPAGLQFDCITGRIAVPANTKVGPFDMHGGILDIPCSTAGLKLHVRGIRLAAAQGDDAADEKVMLGSVVLAAAGAEEGVAAAKTTHTLRLGSGVFGKAGAELTLTAEVLADDTMGALQEWVRRLQELVAPAQIPPRTATMAAVTSPCRGPRWTPRPST
jgi:hypothetical protein